MKSSVQGMDVNSYPLHWGKEHRILKIDQAQFPGPGHIAKISVLFVRIGGAGCYMSNQLCQPWHQSNF